MEKDGLIRFCREEDKRKLYEITELGTEILNLEIKRIERLYRNSKGENVIIQEDGWAEPGTQPTHMMIHILSSCGKAFYGGVGNVVWLDNVQVVM